MIKTNKQSKFTKYRRAHGHQIAELPPALILLIFVFFFPVMNMLYVVCTFAAGWYLNSMQLREVSINVPSAIGLTNPPDSNYHSVILPQSGRWNGFFGISEDVNSPQVAQFPPANNPNIVDRSRVRTTVNVQPMVRMQSLGSFLPLGEIPGLGRPWVFTYTSETPQEEPGP
jgi:hypothetical protein